MSIKNPPKSEPRRGGTLSQFEATYVGTALGIARLEEEGKIVLKVYQGSDSGKVFTFPFGENVAIGRLEKAEVCLPHHSVSRLHSRIFWKNHVPWIADLKSTNGTYLNNEKIQESILHEGDRIRIGDAAIRVEFRYENEGTQTRISRLMLDSEKALKAGEKPPTETQTILSGSLEKISLPDIMQSVVASKGEGIVVIKGSQNGKIYVQKGKVFHAVVGNVKGKKALYRLLNLKTGHFSFRPLDESIITQQPKEELKKMSQEFQGDLTHTLLEYYRIHDEFQQILNRIPAEKTLLSYNPKKPLPNEKGLTRLQQIYEQIRQTPRVQDLLDQIPLVDMDIYRVLTFLLERGYLLKSDR